MAKRKRVKQKVRNNRKRQIVEPKPAQRILNGLARRIRYIGSPYHKRNPGDFGLTPPSQPRPDKTLCDGSGIFKVAEAQKMLREGARRGMVSADPGQNGYPKHIWAVTADNMVLEAKYNNEGPGNYHGYPLFERDPFRRVVLNCWNRP